MSVIKSMAAAFAMAAIASVSFAGNLEEVIIEEVVEVPPPAPVVIEEAPPVENRSSYASFLPLLGAIVIVGVIVASNSD